MRLVRWLVALLLLAGSALGHAQTYGTYSGRCQGGGLKVATQGMPSSTLVQVSYPGCAVAGYLIDTNVKAALYSSDTGASLANPFIANTVGGWTFYAADGLPMDVQRSGEAPPSVPPQPVTTVGAEPSAASSLSKSPVADQFIVQPPGTSLGVTNLTAGSVNGRANPAACGTANPPAWCSGSEMGAWVNAAIAYQHCGTIHIPAGTYHQTTMIVRNLCTNIEGDGSNPGGTHLVWDGTAPFAAQDGSSANSSKFPSGGFKGIFFEAGKGTASDGVLLGCDTSTAYRGAPACSSYGAQSHQTGSAPNPINTYWQDVEIYGFQHGITVGGYAWGFHCTACKIIFNILDGIYVQPKNALGGEEMTVDFSTISNNGRYGLNLGAYLFAGMSWNISHSSIDYNFNAGSGTQIYGSVNLVASHIEQITGLAFDDSGDPMGYINDFGSVFVLDHPSAPNDCFGKHVWGTYSNFHGTTFHAAQHVSSILCGGGNYTAVGLTLSSGASNVNGNNFFSIAPTAGVAQRLASGTDLNLITACGNYDGVRLVSSPPQLAAGFIRVRNDCSNDPTTLTQTAWDMGNNTNRIFARRSSAKVWSPWQEMMTPNDAGVQTLGGVTVQVPLLFTAPPRGACTAGTIGTNADGGRGTTLYVCEAGAWVAK